MIWLEASFGVAHVWYIRALGCPFVLYTALGKDSDLMMDNHTANHTAIHQNARRDVERREW